MFKRNFHIFFILAVIILIINSAFAQDDKELLTQEQFAVQLVKNMKIQDRLPIAALPRDCVNLLESLGISPLKGWHRRILITEDDYTVILAKAVGKENVVHTKAIEICQRIINLINKRWQENQNLSLQELTGDKNIFPEGPPQCPYGLKYKDNDQKIDPHYHSTFFFKR